MFYRFTDCGRAAVRRGIRERETREREREGGREGGREVGAGVLADLPLRFLVSFTLSVLGCIPVLGCVQLQPPLTPTCDAISHLRCSISRAHAALIPRQINASLGSRRFTNQTDACLPYRTAETVRKPARDLE